MAKLVTAAQKFVAAEEGATMVEYGIMVALIAALSVVIISTLGQQVKNAFNTTTTALNTANLGP
jgi:pilus assembly protein Flp/PilA